MNSTPATAIRDWYHSLGDRVRPWVAAFFNQTSKFEFERAEADLRVGMLLNKLPLDPDLDYTRLVLIFRSSADYALYFIGRDEATRIEDWRENVRLGVQPFARFSQEALDALPEWRGQYESAVASWSALKASWLDNEPLDRFLSEWARSMPVEPEVESKAAELHALFEKLRSGEN